MFKRLVLMFAASALWTGSLCWSADAPIARIVGFEVPSGLPTETYPGTSQRTTVKIKNTGSSARTFWIGLSYAGPNAEEWPGNGWFDVPPKQVPDDGSTLGAGEEMSVVFDFFLPDWIPAGQYRAYAAVWGNYVPDVQEVQTSDGKIYHVAGLMEPSEAYARDEKDTFFIKEYTDDNPLGLSEMDPPGGLYGSIPNKYKQGGSLVELPARRSNSNYRLTDSTGAPLTAETPNIMVLFHGWNWGVAWTELGHRRQYETGEFKKLIDGLMGSATQPRTLPTNWKLLPYAWYKDADTGLLVSRNWTSSGVETQGEPYGMSLESEAESKSLTVAVAAGLAYVGIECAEQMIAANSTIAAFRAYMHGLFLGERLLQNVGAMNLKKVHIVAHSAGAWGAYAAASYLMYKSGTVEVQVTYLDPFIPANMFSEITFSEIWGAAAKFKGDCLAAVPTRVNTLNAFSRDCYWSYDDLTYWGGAITASGQDVLGKIAGIPDAVAMLVDYVCPDLSDSTVVGWTWGGNEALVFRTDESLWDDNAGHSGPVSYYADSVNSPDSSTFSGRAWSKSLAFNSPEEEKYVLTIDSSPSGAAIALNLADQNGNQNGVAPFTRTYSQGTTVILTAPSSFDGCAFKEWQKNGVTYSTANSVTLSISESQTFRAVYQVLDSDIWVAGSTAPDAVEKSAGPGNGWWFRIPVQNRKTTPVTVNVTKSGSAKDWVWLKGGTSFTLDGGETQWYEAPINIPDDADAGSYVATILFNGIAQDFIFTVYKVERENNIPLMESGTVVIDARWVATSFPVEDYGLSPYNISGTSGSSTWPTFTLSEKQALNADYYYFVVNVEKQAASSTQNLNAYLNGKLFGTQLSSSLSSGNFTPLICTSRGTCDWTALVGNRNSYNNVLSFKPSSWKIGDSTVLWRVNPFAASLEFFIRETNNAWKSPATDIAYNLWNRIQDDFLAYARVSAHVDYVTVPGRLALYCNNKLVGYQSVSSAGNIYWRIQRPKSDLMREDNVFVIKGEISGSGDSGDGTVARLSDIRLVLRYDNEIPELQLTKTVEPNPLLIGQQATVKVTLLNPTEYSTTGNDTSLVDADLPTGLTLVSGSLSDSSFGERVEEGESDDHTYVISAGAVGYYTLGSAKFEYKTIDGDELRVDSDPAVLEVRGGGLTVTPVFTKRDQGSGSLVDCSASVTATTSGANMSDALVCGEIYKQVSGSWVLVGSSFVLGYDTMQMKYRGSSPSVNAAGSYKCLIKAQRAFYDDGLSSEYLFDVAESPSHTLTVNSSNPDSGVAITSTTGHEGTTSYTKTVFVGETINLEAPESVGSGASRKRFVGWDSNCSVGEPVRNKTFQYDTLCGDENGDMWICAVYEDAPEFAPTITTSSPLPDGTVGSAYSVTLAASGGKTPYTWSRVSGSLPAGLSLSSGGVISGKPTASGTSSFTIRVTDDDNRSSTKAFNLTINLEQTAPTITTSSPLPNGTVGSAYSVTLAASGGETPYTWSRVSGSLPVGLALSSGGVISGKPTASGPFNFTIRVTGGNNLSSTKVFSLTINPNDDDPPCDPTGDAVLTTTGTYDGFFYANRAFGDDEVPTVLGKLNVILSNLDGKLTAMAVLQAGPASFSGKLWTRREGDGTMFTTLTTRGGERLDLFVRQNRIWGTLKGGKAGAAPLALEGARNRFADKKDAAAQAILNRYKGYYTATLFGRDFIQGSLNAAPQGYGYLTLTVNNGGKVRIAGILADGTKVSQSSQLLHFADCGEWLCVPLFVPLYRKTGYVGGLFWIDPDTREIYCGADTGESVRWEKPGKGPDGFIGLLEMWGGVYAPALTLSGIYLFDANLDYAGCAYHYAGGAEECLFGPDEVPVDVTGSRMKIARGDRPVKISEDGETRYVYGRVNPNMVTLSFTARTGIFKGRYTLYYDYYDDRDRFQHKAVRVPYVGVMLRDPETGRLETGLGHCLFPSKDLELKAYKIKPSFPVRLWSD